jgi:hypothetical protein
LIESRLTIGGIFIFGFAQTFPGRSMKIDWSECQRNHADRRNLLMHIVAVPLFVGAILSLCRFTSSMAQQLIRLATDSQ